VGSLISQAETAVSMLFIDQTHHVITSGVCGEEIAGKTIGFFLLIPCPRHQETNFVLSGAERHILIILITKSMGSVLVIRGRVLRLTKPYTKLACLRAVINFLLLLEFEIILFLFGSLVVSRELFKIKNEF